MYEAGSFRNRPSGGPVYFCLLMPEDTEPNLVWRGPLLHLRHPSLSGILSDQSMGLIGAGWGAQLIKTPGDCTPTQTRVGPGVFSLSYLTRYLILNSMSWSPTCGRRPCIVDAPEFQGFNSFLFGNGNQTHPQPLGSCGPLQE